MKVINNSTVRHTQKKQDFNEHMQKSTNFDKITRRQYVGKLNKFNRI